MDPIEATFLDFQVPEKDLPFEFAPSPEAQNTPSSHNSLLGDWTTVYPKAMGLGRVSGNIPEDLGITHN